MPAVLLDEEVHVLVEFEGQQNTEPFRRVEVVAKTIAEALSTVPLRTPWTTSGWSTGGSSSPTTA